MVVSQKNVRRFQVPVCYSIFVWKIQANCNFFCYYRDDMLESFKFELQIGVRQEFWEGAKNSVVFKWPKGEFDILIH